MAAITSNELCYKTSKTSWIVSLTFAIFSIVAYMRAAIEAIVAVMQSQPYSYLKKTAKRFRVVSFINYHNSITTFFKCLYVK